LYFLRWHSDQAGEKKKMTRRSGSEKYSHILTPSQRSVSSVHCISDNVRQLKSMMTSDRSIIMTSDKLVMTSGDVGNPVEDVEGDEGHREDDTRSSVYLRHTVQSQSVSHALI
jgi:hypothetical protein